MSKVALLVVDVQKAYHEAELMKKSVDWSLFAIREALEIFRNSKNPIYFVHHVGPLTPEGSEGFELSSALSRNETEYQIIKRHGNSFYQTDLKEKLLRENVNFVVICGLAAGGCINATMQGATESGFEAAILQHGIAGPKDSWVEVAHETHPVISRAALKYFLKK
jgi:nicotinamidase-related amidase